MQGRPPAAGRRLPGGRPGRLLLGCGVLACAVLAGCGHPARAVLAPVPKTSSATPTTSSPAPAPPPAPPPIWPLTGLPRPAAEGVPVTVAIKIDNAPSAWPQTGLNDADLVYEALVEGGMSRFLAVFNSHSAGPVGPVRSARPVDGALLRGLNGGIFGYSGAARGEIAPAQAYSNALLISNDADSRPFYREGSRRPPSNLFTTTDALRAEAARLGGAHGTPPEMFHYGPAAPGALATGQLSIVIGPAATAQWNWDGQQWLRGQDGAPHVLATGQRVSATNVVVLKVQVTHSGITDAAGNEDPFVLAYGSGDALVLSRGTVQAGHWSRPTVLNPLALTSADGTPLGLSPGRTWVELVPVSGSAVTR